MPIGKLLLAAVGGGGGTITLSGETISDMVTGSAYVQINGDGTVDKYDPTVSQIDSATDWIIPNAAGNSSYEVKWTLTSGDTPTVTNMAVANTWYALTSDRYVGYSPAIPNNTESGDIVVYIGRGGTVLASATYTISAREVS